ncbi:MAG TPA: hypothetical protein VMS64_12400 [Candidatus Methylomirabilis sp.]|nr:hypothetical protein [Candidatus Methylomirabilis sp.]
MAIVAWRRQAPAWIALTLLFVTVVRLGMGLGYANNGDFWRAMAPSGIVYRAGLSDRQIFFRDRQAFYQLGPSPLHPGEVMYSLEDLVVWAAMILQKALAPAATARGVFHLFPVSAILAALGYVLVRAAWPASEARRWLAVGLVWVAADPYYSLFLGSMYSEGLAIVALLGLALALLVMGGSVRAGILVGVCLFLFTFSKTQSVLTPVLLACVWLAVLRRRPSLRVVGVLVVVFAATAAFFSTRPPQTKLRAVGDFHTVFYGVAMTSAEPASVLADLGFSPEAVELVGRPMFAAETRLYLYPGFEAELASFSRWRALLVHLREPTAVRDVLRRASAALRTTRIDYLGQYEEPYGLPGAGVCGPFDFCAPRSVLSDRAWPLYWAVLALASGVVLSAGAWRWLRMYWLFLALFATTHVYIVFLASGLFEFEKHLVLARLALDFLFVTGCAVVTRSATVLIFSRLSLSRGGITERPADLPPLGARNPAR